MPAHGVKAAAKIALQHIDNSEKAAVASDSRLPMSGAGLASRSPHGVMPGYVPKHLTDDPGGMRPSGLRVL
jgi:hypothetical protein